MRIAGIALANAMALSVCMPAALAQDAVEGMITRINRLNGTVAIQQIQSGTVGASTTAAAEEFKVQDGVVLEQVHAGDRVTFTATDSGGVKTITRLERKKP